MTRYSKLGILGQKENSVEAVMRIKREICSTSGATGKKSRGKLLLPPERAAEGDVSSEVIQVRASGERMLGEQVSSGYEIPRAPSTGFRS